MPAPRTAAFLIGAVWAALGCLTTGDNAGAHGADSNTGDIRLAGDTAYVVVWPSTAAFAQYDGNGDGRIAPDETRRNRSAILEQFHDSFTLVDDAGSRGELVFEDLSTPGLDVSPGSEGHLRVTLRYRWNHEPRWLELRYTLEGALPARIHASRVQPGFAVTEQRLIGRVESVTITRDTPHPRLLRAMSQSATPSQGEDPARSKTPAQGATPQD